MDNYKVFTDSDVLAYIKANNQWFSSTDNLKVNEISDGNLNSVFRVSHANEDKSIIVKQALPYIRCVGEAWQLTRERASKEINVLLEHAKYALESTVKILHYDHDKSLIILEDLAEFKILRTVLLEDKLLNINNELIAKHLAKTLFYTSEFALDFKQKALLEVKGANPEMCQTTDVVFFSDPYYDAPNNNIAQGLELEAEKLWNNLELHKAVSILQSKFKNQRQALIHGDLHTGSIMIYNDKIKVIDAEFGFYGPMGFDIGLYLANLILNYSSLVGHFSQDTLVQKQDLLLNSIKTVVEIFEKTLFDLIKEHSSNPLFSDDVIKSIINNIWQDSLGFAGTEIIRRVIGIAHVIDVDSINDAQIRLDCQKKLLNIGTDLILNSAKIDNVAKLIEKLN